MALNIERRKFGRRQTRIAAWIKIPGRPRIGCRVTNRGPEGALLELDTVPELPFRFRVQLEGEERELLCEIKHVTPHGVGVRWSEVRQAEQGFSHSKVIESDEWAGAARHRTIGG